MRPTQSCASSLQNMCIRGLYTSCASDLRKLSIRPSKVVHPTYYWLLYLIDVHSLAVNSSPSLQYFFIIFYTEMIFFFEQFSHSHCSILLVELFLSELILVSILTPPPPLHSLVHHPPTALILTNWIEFQILIQVFFTSAQYSLFIL